MIDQKLSVDVSPLPAAAPGDPEALYLDLLKRSLTNWIYADSELKPLAGRGAMRLLRKAFAAALGGPRALLVRSDVFDPRSRAEGNDRPVTAHTMIGLRRLDNLQKCSQEVLDRNVPGDFLEAGVWRGGGSIFMRGVLKVRRVTDRRVWVCDSFAGLPPPDADRYPLDAGSTFHLHERLAVSLEQVQANFERYGLLDGQVVFLKGWFRDTLPKAPIDRLALLRLDGDMYESTMDALRSLYPKLSPGGFAIIDDYFAVEGCRAAVSDYQKEHGFEEKIIPIDRMGGYWRRGT